MLDFSAQLLFAVGGVFASLSATNLVGDENKEYALVSSICTFAGLTTQKLSVFARKVCDERTESLNSILKDLQLTAVQPIHHDIDKNDNSY